MNYKILATVSAVALLAMAPVAKAEDVDSASKLRVEAQTGVDTSTQPINHAGTTNTTAGANRADAKIDTQAEMRTGTQSGEKSDRVDVELNAKATGNTVKEDAKQSWENTKQAASETVDDVKYTLFGKEPKGAPASIVVGATAKGLLDKPVHNGNNERVGTLKDIIIDSKGNATLAVVSDAELINIGAKEAAFDYSMVLRRDEKGDVVMPLTEDTINNARKFSYDTNDAGKENVRTIPAGGYSVEKLLKANVVNSTGEKVASVDNVTFRNGRASDLVVGFDKVLGMGGEKAALTFSDVKMISKGDGNVEFQLSASQAAQFESFKQAASN